MVSTVRLVAVCAVVLLVGGGAWRIHQAGYSSGARACELAHAELARDAARQERADAAARQRAAVEAGKAQAAARLDQLRRRDALEHDLARRPAPADCGLDAESVRVLNDAIRAGNDGPPASAGGLPGGVPGGTGTE